MRPNEVKQSVRIIQSIGDLVKAVDDPLIFDLLGKLLGSAINNVVKFNLDCSSNPELIKLLQKIMTF